MISGSLRPPTESSAALGFTQVRSDSFRIDRRSQTPNMGQGDVTLLAGPEFTILIDAGRRDRSEVFSGDTEAHGGWEMVERIMPLRAQILKMGHHGSRTSSHFGF